MAADIERRYSIAIYVILGLLGLLIILSYYIIQSHYPPGNPPLWALLLKELGFALMIAVVLIFSVDRFTRQRHERDVNQWLALVSNDLFRAVLQRSTPENLYREVEKSLFYRDYFRRDTAIAYTLRKFSAPDGEVPDAKKERFRKCNVHFHYTVVNVNQANRNIVYPLTLVLDVLDDPDLSRFNKIIAVEVNGRAIPIDERIEGNLLRFEHPIEIGRGESIRVRCEWSQVVKDEDQEVWSSTDPTDGVTFTVNTPDGDLTVLGDSMHSEALSTLQRNEVAVTWELRHGVFPYQGIYFRWKKR